MRELWDCHYSLDVRLLSSLRAPQEAQKADGLRDYSTKDTARMWEGLFWDSEDWALGIVPRPFHKRRPRGEDLLIWSR